MVLRRRLTVLVIVQGEPITPPTPVAEHPGNETAAFQQGAREQFANCGANVSRQATGLRHLAASALVLTFIQQSA